jgi:hypothetical protein
LIKDYEKIQFEFNKNIEIDGGDPSLAPSLCSGLRLRMTGLCGVTEGKKWRLDERIFNKELMYTNRHFFPQDHKTWVSFRVFIQKFCTSSIMTIIQISDNA